MCVCVCVCSNVLTCDLGYTLHRLCTVVSIVTSYRLDGPGFESQLGRWFSLLKNFEAWLWCPCSLLFSGFQDSFPGVMQLEHEVDHSAASSAEIKTV